jgi:hypothetical protein
MAALAHNVTDRAHRYRAVANSEMLGPQRCAFCGCVHGIMVGHVDGHEENGEPDNLIWTCRSCNAIAANTMKKAGVGRRTVQMNPRKKSAGAQNLGEWMQAVGAITPKVDRGNRGLVSDMPVSEAVAIIRATPHSRRSRFAAELGRRGGERYNPKTRSNLFGWGSKPEKKVSGKRSSMTLASATKAAFKAGQVSGDTGAFESWAESKGLSDRGPWLERAYEKGVVAGETAAEQKAATRYSDRPIASKPLKDVTYKGYRIYHQGEGFRTSADRGESEFDDVKEAKRFIDDEVKMRRNPDRVTYQLSLNGKSIGSRSVPASMSATELQRSLVLHEGYDKAIKVKANPRTRRNSAEAADYAYQKFHGREPGEAVFLEDEEHVHEHLAVAGLLLELRVDLVTGYEALLTFEDDPPFLCITEDGQQLYIEGGSQAIDLKELHFDDKKWIKDRMIIGQFSPPGDDLRDGSKAKWNIGYQTEKDFDQFEEILYQHDLGEETSINGKSSRVREEDRVRPFLEYEPRNERLYITGGKYWINLPLIGTSPGIEN